MSRFDDMVAMASHGVRQRKRPRHEEDDLQVSCIRWFDYRYPNLRRLLHHSPNEGLLVHKSADGAKRKAMGVRAGFPDLILLVPSGGYPYLAIELKTGSGRQSDTQKEYQKAVEDAGGRYELVRSLDGFMSVVDGYLSKING